MTSSSASSPPGARLAAAFDRARRENRAALILYLTAGYPDAATSEAIVRRLAHAGCDLLELGVPFSDPIADGPTIQEASRVALAAGASLAGVLELARATSDARPPTVLFSALNPLLQHGYERLAADATAAGIDGLLIPDLPMEEEPDLRAAAARHGLAVPLLAAPTSPPARKRALAAASTGFVYYIAVRGVTGARADVAADLAAQIAPLRATPPPGVKSMPPVAVGFGIASPEQVAAVARLADGVVVGSALIDVITRHRNAPHQTLLDAVESLVRSLAAATRRTGHAA